MLRKFSSTKPISEYLHCQYVQGTHVGIELELEGIQTNFQHPICHHFRVDRDGSLRNGIELVSQRLPLDKYYDISPVITSFLRENRAVCTPRCSTHVHVNVSDLTLEQLNSFVAIAVMFEPLLFELAGDIRKGNTYCVPFRYGANLPFAWVKLFERLSSTSPGFPKYAGISAFRLADLGTIEFRMLAGTSARTMYKLDALVQFAHVVRGISITHSLEQLSAMNEGDQLINLVLSRCSVLSDAFRGIEIINFIDKGAFTMLTTRTLDINELLNIRASLLPSVTEDSLASKVSSLLSNSDVVEALTLIAGADSESAASLGRAHPSLVEYGELVRRNIGPAFASASQRPGFSMGAFIQAATQLKTACSV